MFSLTHHAAAVLAVAQRPLGRNRLGVCSLDWILGVPVLLCYFTGRRETTAAGSSATPPPWPRPASPRTSLTHSIWCNSSQELFSKQQQRPDRWSCFNSSAAPPSKTIKVKNNLGTVSDVQCWCSFYGGWYVPLGWHTGLIRRKQLFPFRILVCRKDFSKISPYSCLVCKMDSPF